MVEGTLDRGGAPCDQNKFIALDSSNISERARLRLAIRLRRLRRQPVQRRGCEALHRAPERPSSEDDVQGGIHRVVEKAQYPL